MTTKHYFATSYDIGCINYIYILIERCTTGDIRLYGGGYYYGAVQVCIEGVWGSICSNSFWDNNDASVVCKQLGFSPYGMYHNTYYLKLIFQFYRVTCNNYINL